VTLVDISIGGEGTDGDDGGGNVAIDVCERVLTFEIIFALRFELILDVNTQ